MKGHVERLRQLVSTLILINSKPKVHKHLAVRASRWKFLPKLVKDFHTEVRIRGRILFKKGMMIRVPSRRWTYKGVH
ncbi:hypothetical protein P3L10_015873 [Capsicum annuum]